MSKKPATTNKLNSTLCKTNRLKTMKKLSKSDLKTILSHRKLFIKSKRHRVEPTRVEERLRKRTKERRVASATNHTTKISCSDTSTKFTTKLSDTSAIFVVLVHFSNAICRLTCQNTSRASIANKSTARSAHRPSRDQRVCEITWKLSMVKTQKFCYAFAENSSIFDISWRHTSNARITTFVIITVNTVRRSSSRQRSWVCMCWRAIRQDTLTRQNMHARWVDWIQLKLNILNNSICRNVARDYLAQKVWRLTWSTTKSLSSNAHMKIVQKVSSLDCCWEIIWWVAFIAWLIWLINFILCFRKPTLVRKILCVIRAINPSSVQTTFDDTSLCLMTKFVFNVSCRNANFLLGERTISGIT